ncbi:MAG: MtrB/PioB family outer membrane beta-barrel protein [Thermoanaerobaculia bacterium]
MRTRRTAATILFASLICLLAGPSLIAEDAGEDGWSGLITPKLFLLSRPSGDETRFLERYQIREGLGGDEVYLDLDLNLTYRDGDRNIFTLEQTGDGTYNRRGRARFNADKVSVFGSYAQYRSATGSLGFLYSPGQAPGGTDPSYNTPAQTGSGYFAQFNDDSGRSIYEIDRTNYGVGIRLKPSLLGGLAAVDLRYEGYERDGNRFAPWIAGGSDFTGPLVQLQRWRGFDQPVDEAMGDLSLSVTLSPGQSLQLAYEGSVESFDSKAHSFTMGDFAGQLPSGNAIGGTNGTKPLHFVPDTTLTNHAVRFSKSHGGLSLAAGYGTSVLDQDSYTQRQQGASYEGEISSENAYFQLTSRLSKAVTVEGSLRYRTRENDSTFPAPGLISPTEAERLGVRINSIESLEYELSANFRHTESKSTFTAGWKREDANRDLTFHASPGITSQRSLYSEDSLSDELYLTVVSRPRKGLTLRITPSYIRGGDTALVTEPEDALSLKTLVSYVTPAGTMISGYYNYKDEQNAGKSFTNAVSPTGADGASIDQDTTRTLNSFGAMLSLTPATDLNLSFGLDWIQNDFASYYFSTNRRRFESPAGGITFSIRDRSNYTVDTMSLSLNGQWQARETLVVSGGYTHAQSQGDVASGLIASELASTVDGTIDNMMNSLLLGVSHQPRDRFSLWAQLLYDDYADDAYDVMSGSLLTITVGFTFKL